MGSDILALAADLARRREPFALATVVWRRGPSSGKPSAKAIVLPDGTLQGWIGGACAEPAVTRHALAALQDGQPRLVRVGPPDEAEPGRVEGMVSVVTSCQSEGALEVYVEPVLPKPQLVVVGRSPAVDALSAMAEVLGWRTAVVDSEWLRHQAVDGSFVVVATQGHDDEDALAAALAGNASYIGLVASVRRAASVLEDLRRRGIPDDRLRLVHAPAGLDLGRVDHQEIAVAILAELVALKAARQLPVAGLPATAEARPEAIDPVCGMTVDVLSAQHSTVRDGEAYYFCCSGCLARF